jgi:hypothetical protein
MHVADRPRRSKPSDTAGKVTQEVPGIVGHTEVSGSKVDPNSSTPPRGGHPRVWKDHIRCYTRSCSVQTWIEPTDKMRMGVGLFRKALNDGLKPEMTKLRLGEP